MANLMDILGGGLPAGLLSPEQEAAAQQRAQNAGLLNLAFGLLQASRGAPGQGRPSLGQIIGQAGPVGVAGYQQSFEDTLKRSLQGMQIAEMRRKQEEQDRLRQARERFTQRMQEIGGGVTTPSMALSAGGGPTTEAAARIGQPLNVAQAQQSAATELLGQIAPEEIAKLAFREPKESFRILSNPEKEQLGLPKDMAYQMSSTGKISQVGQGPLVQNFVGGEKGFKNELELKNNFKAEPVYKAYQEMQSAYGQVTESLKKGTPAGDLAGATKFMKLLDPGSVVRESELYLAMSASGAMDRFRNYADMVLTGKKLTPTQRQDFQGLADRLFADSTNAYNSKRSEYLELGKAYGLNAERALGAIAKPPLLTQRETTPVTPTKETPSVRQMVETSKAPSGVRQELWNIMTPEQKKLWQ